MKSSLISLLLILIPVVAFSQQDDTIKERLARLEVGQEAINQRIDDVNQRIDDLRNDLDKRFNWLYILLSAVIALIGAMLGSVIWLARQERPMSKREFRRLLDKTDVIDLDISDLKSRVNRLETVKG